MAAPPPFNPNTDRERDRLLTLANVQRMRGQLTEAEETLKKALLLAPDTAKENAPIHEMIGDILAGDEKWEAAKAAYEQANKINPDRTSAERKFAEMALRIADEKAERAMAEAMLRGELPPGGSVGLGGKRKPGLALLLSAVAPGFGQIYNGQIGKGVFCLAAFALAWLLILLSPDSELMSKQVLQLFFPGNAIAGAQGDVPPFLWFLLLLASSLWFFAVLDAPVQASKIAAVVQTPGGQTIDKSGWEV